jgi:glycerophosphoryl diester phosphodiesterase
MILNRVTSIALVMALLQACSDSAGVAGAAGPAAPPSALTVLATATPEGAPGEMTILRFRATLNEPQDSDIEIRYETRAQTATAGVDYLDTAGDVSIPAGALEAFIEVELLGDAEEEPGETFTLDFSHSGNATAQAATVTGTIANDDTACDAPFEISPNPWLVDGADPLNFAHRGGLTDFPDNTLYAYSEAAIVGADVLEMDIFQTNDNHLVVLHDQAGVGRTTNGEGMIVDLTLAEVKALDAAYWFIPDEGTRRDRPEEDYVLRGIATGDKPPPPGYSANDFKIPTLEEVLQRFPHKLINVELKEDDGVGDYEQQLADLLLDYGRLEDLIVVSFDDAVTSNFKRAAPCMPTALPLGQGLAIFTEFLTTGAFTAVPEHIAAQIPPDASFIGDQIPGDDPIPIVTPALVEAAHAVDMPVQVWTINTCEEMLRMIDLGVDGIMTDEPVLLESVLAQPPGERSCDEEAGE